MLTDTRRSPYSLMEPVQAGRATITGDGPLARMRDRAVDVTVPSMGELMFDAEISHAYQNFLVASGDLDGEHQGPPFLDGDMYKWLESAVVVAAETAHPQLSEWIGRASTAIAAAQQTDGYLHTKTTIAQSAGEDRVPLQERMDFETYNFGHLMTLAAVHQRHTGDSSYLDVAERVAAYLASTVQSSPELLADCNICPSHYMGLIELYRTTGNADYLVLAGRLIDLHGGKGNAGTDDNQDVLPVREQRHAVGHGVRSTYLYAGMADYVLETGDERMRQALLSIWDDLVSRKIYITGGCGALYDGASPDAAQDYASVARVHQSFGRAHQLPQTTAYNESCASLGLVMWAWRMLLLTGESRFADEIERVMYNLLPATIGLDGKSYFYTNPLRQVRDLPFHMRRAGNPASSQPSASHDRPRQEYMTACFCCPPNIARVIVQTPYYVASSRGAKIWLHQYIAGEVSVDVDGNQVLLRQTTRYPLESRVQIDVTADVEVSATIRLRIPGWSRGATVTIDGEQVALDAALDDGYVVLDGTWKSRTIVVDVPVPARLVAAHHFVEEATNQVAVVRGPVVYCLESADLPEGVGIEQVYIPRSASFAEREGSDEMAGNVLLATSALRLRPSVGVGELYADLQDTDAEPIDITLVPYGVWNNRGAGEMSVWLPLHR